MGNTLGYLFTTEDHRAVIDLPVGALEGGNNWVTIRLRALPGLPHQQGACVDQVTLELGIDTGSGR